MILGPTSPTKDCFNAVGLVCSFRTIHLIRNFSPRVIVLRRNKGIWLVIGPVIKSSAEKILRELPIPRLARVATDVATKTTHLVFRKELFCPSTSQSTSLVENKMAWDTELLECAGTLFERGSSRNRGM